MRIGKRTGTKTWLSMSVVLGPAWIGLAIAQPATEATGASSEHPASGSAQPLADDPSAAPPESIESLSARVRTARRVAAEQRQAALAQAPSTRGLTQSQLEIIAGERNLAVYELQISTGQGSPAVDSFRKLTLATLADARRKELWRVWSNAIYHPEAFDVLSEHGRTMAELRRIQFLARFKGYASLVTQTERLMRQASGGFEREMQRMQNEVLDNPSFARVSIELREQAQGDAREQDRQR